MDIVTYPDYFHEAKGKEFMISMLTFQKKKKKEKKQEITKNFGKLKNYIKNFKFL